MVRLGFKKLNSVFLCRTTLCFVACSLQVLSAAQPNILFIFSDDHALKSISAYAGEAALIQTPNIDRLAEQGAIFTRSFCGNSICQPSRASILTGKHSHKNGVLENGSLWNSEQLVFPRLLEAAGYQTAMIGKWHMHPYPSDEFSYHKTLTGSGGQGRYYNPEFVTMNGRTVVEEGYSTDLITDESIRWLEARDPERPFLLMTQFKSPHTNVMPPIRNLDLLKNNPIPVPETYHSDGKGRSACLGKTYMSMKGMRDPNVLKTGKQIKYFDSMTPAQRAAWKAHYDPLNREWERRLASGDVTEREKMEFPYQRYVKDYLRCVAAVDENVGRLIDWVDQAGLTEDTIVIYSSDQGFFLGEQGRTDKRLMDEVTMSMPFLIRWPKAIAPGQRIDAMIQNIDYAPTFLDAAGLSVPDEMQGCSLLPLFSGNKPETWRSSLYYHYYQSGAYNLPKIEGVRTERYKLIRYYGHPRLDLEEQWELFDLSRDPDERESVYDHPEYAGVLGTMRRELHELRKQYEVPQ